MKLEEFKPRPLGTYISMHLKNVAESMMNECSTALYNGKPLKAVFESIAIRYLKEENEVQHLRYDIKKLKGKGE